MVSDYNLLKKENGPFLMIEKRIDYDNSIYSSGGRQVFTGDHYDLDIACGEDNKFIEREKKQFENVLLYFKRLSRSYNFIPIFLIEPSVYDMTHNHDINPDSLKKYCKKYNRSNLASFFLNEIMRKEEWPIVDLTETFQNCGTCFFSEEERLGDNHWNSKGISVAAELLAKKIISIDQR